MLNSQPMGFYSPSQLIQDAQRHDVAVRPIDVAVSGWDSALEEFSPAADSKRQPAVRLGLNRVGSFNEKAALRIVDARGARPFEDIHDLARRAALSTNELDALAAADALAALAGHRRQARWEAAGARALRANGRGTGRNATGDLIADAPIREQLPALPEASEAREIVDDYASTGFTLRRHPLALLRPRLAAMHLASAEALRAVPDGRNVRTTGIVTVRQRPGTAKGTIFVTLEDETGAINVIVWPTVVEAQRRPLLTARLLTVHGTWQRQGDVCHVVARRLFDHSALLGELGVSSRDFH
jgi:error-prone DNA polymerase